jgi:hypothetical protein
VNKTRKSKADDNACRGIFVGMDVHKNYLQVAVMHKKGKVRKNSRMDYSQSY